MTFNSFSIEASGQFGDGSSLLDGWLVGGLVFARRRFRRLWLSFSTIQLLLDLFFFEDAGNILFFYAIFAILWQRNIEGPVKNEVEELDFGRGAVAIFMACTVALVLPVLRSRAGSVSRQHRVLRWQGTLRQLPPAVRG